MEVTSYCLTVAGSEESVTVEVEIQPEQVNFLVDLCRTVNGAGVAWSLAPTMKLTMIQERQVTETYEEVLVQP